MYGTDSCTASDTFLFVRVFIYHASLLQYVDLSDIRYHFTPCQSVGKTGPDYDSCRPFYADRNSLIAADDILLPSDESKAYQEHAQVFRVTRDTVYNVTLAGATGGRGLCNIEEGRGLVFHLRVTLSTELHYLLLVGQKGLAGALQISPGVVEEEVQV